MRYLVLGASGMAGHVIAIYLLEQGHEVMGFCRRPVGFVPCVEGDARNVGFLRRTIEESECDIVVNAVGILNKAAEGNPGIASFINSELPHLLAEWTAGTDARVFQMSTDCVFAGNTGPYTEDSVPDGGTVYDTTKAAGEINDYRNMTFRNSIVGPDINEEGIGLFNWFMGQTGPIKGYRKAIWTGLTTLELAKAMEHASLEGATGLVNMVPKESISKYELLQLFNRHFRSGDVAISPSDDVSIDKSLIRTNFSCSFSPKSYEVQIMEMAEWVRRHVHLYPHYEL